MPSKHSKNCGDRGHFTYGEKKNARLGSIKQRLGSDSQLPFGYCPLSLAPARDAVISPSGHIYSRESILEYLLKKTQEIKEQTKEFLEQEQRDSVAVAVSSQQGEMRRIEKFARNEQGVSEITKKSLTDKEESSSYLHSRKRIIDDTSSEIKLEQLRQVSPWITQFTPSAEKRVAEPPKRPSSPFSGNPLRAKDLIPLELVEDRESDVGTVRFVCPVSRKAITNQKMVFLKNTGTLLTEAAAEQLAFPTMTCPLTSKPFRRTDIIQIAGAASSFAASGQVEAKKYRPSFN